MASKATVKREEDFSGTEVAGYETAEGTFVQGVVKVDAEGDVIPANTRGDANIIALLDYSEDDNATQWVSLVGKPLMGLIVPILESEDSICHFEITIDGGTTPLELRAIDGDAKAVEFLGSDVAYALTTDYLTCLAGYGGAECEVRIVVDEAQTADRTFVFLTQP